MKYALNLSEDKRILSVTYEEFATKYMPLVDELPEGNVCDYLYINNEYIFNPLPVVEPAPSKLDRIESQIVYTAMMTNTLVEGDV